MDAIPLQQIRDKILGITGGLHGGLESTIYLQEIRDAILSVTGGVFGSLNEAIYLQQIRDAVLGVTAAPGTYGSLSPAIYLQQIRDAYLSVTSNLTGGLDEGLYLGEILGAAAPPGSAGPQYETPSYSNEGGTGDRSRWITVAIEGFSGTSGVPGNNSILVDGDQGTVVVFWESQAVAGKRTIFKFPTPVRITEVKEYIDAGFDGYAGTTWKWRGSNDNGANWTDIGAAYTPPVGATKTLMSMSANEDVYLWYCKEGVSGSTTSFEAPTEYEFKIASQVDVYRNVYILGDSKSAGTAATIYPAYLWTLLNTATEKAWKEVLPRSASGGWGIADLYVSVFNNIASVTPDPEYAIINIAVNDGSPAISENDYKTYMQGILDLIHTNFPTCQVYITRIWLRLGGTFPDNIATWIADLVALNSFAHPGADERVYLENGDDGVTYTSDGIHPTDPAGYQLMSQKAGEAMGFL